MHSNLHSPPPDDSDAKAAFRKPLSDTANRKYRRHSPASGSLSSDGSPIRDRSSSPAISKKYPAKISDYRQKRKDDVREYDRDRGRGQYGRRGDSSMHFDRKSSRVLHGNRRYDDYRSDRYADEEERNYHKLSSRSGRDTRDGSRSDNYDGGHNRSRDYARNVNKYPRDKYNGTGHGPKDKEIDEQTHKDRDLSSDKTGSGRKHANSNYDEIKSGECDKHMRHEDDRDEKRDHRRGTEDGKSENTLYHEKSRGHGTQSILRKDGVHHLEEAHKSDLKELDGSKHAKQEKRKYDGWESNRHKDRFVRESGEQYEEKAHAVRKSEESPSRKSKHLSLDKGSDYGKDANETWSPSSKQARGTVGKVTPEQAHTNESESATDVNAAKVAAIKAAELVNRNLVGVGVLSTDQKKKLLWGSKKNTAVEESGHRWDTALFSDRERQEKFNKLMGVKGELKVEEKPESQDGSTLQRAEKEKELQLDLEKQYTAGLRRRDGRTVGLGL